MNKVLVSALGVLCLISTAFAGEWTRPWSIGPTVSYYYYASKRHIDPQMLGGISGGYGLSDNLRAEIWYGHLSSNYNGHHRSDNVKGGLYNLNVLYSFRVATPLQPYVLGGLGVSYIDPPMAGDTDTQAHLQVGVGTTYFMSTQVALRGDVQDLYTPNGGKHDQMAMVSLLFYFG